jgi:hypothetical protein
MIVTERGTRDANIWTELPFALDNGHVPAIPRRWLFVGESRGEQCRFPITLESRHPSLPHYYKPAAVFAHNCYYCPDWVNVKSLVDPTSG